MNILTASDDMYFKTRQIFNSIQDGNKQYEAYSMLIKDVP